VFRAKYQVSQGEKVHIAAALLQLGTGDAGNFLGTGDTAIRPFLVFSRTLGHNITPHLNIGYEFNVDQSERSALEYALGFDAGNNRYTFAGELLGSHESDGDGIGDDIVDTAWGFKWNPKGRLLVGLNTRFPLNDADLRSHLQVEFKLNFICQICIFG
tara:strand:+ start:440 stop:913 length:474 start_codon:yes stop_codon:yes gene_type:complete